MEVIVLPGGVIKDDQGERRTEGAVLDLSEADVKLFTSLGIVGPVSLTVSDKAAADAAAQAAADMAAADAAAKAEADKAAADKAAADAAAKATETTSTKKGARASA
jgi:hypothetical protein